MMTLRCGLDCGLGCDPIRIDHIPDPEMLITYIEAHGVTHGRDWRMLAIDIVSDVYSDTLAAALIRQIKEADDE
jgi:hypothetical protein